MKFFHIKTQSRRLQRSNVTKIAKFELSLKRNLSPLTQSSERIVLSQCFYLLYFRRYVQLKADSNFFHLDFYLPPPKEHSKYISVFYIKKNSQICILLVRKHLSFQILLVIICYPIGSKILTTVFFSLPSINFGEHTSTFFNGVNNRSSITFSQNKMNLLEKVLQYNNPHYKLSLYSLDKLIVHVDDWPTLITKI